MARALTRTATITAAAMQGQFFSDFTDDFVKHPVTNSLAIVKNSESIKQGFMNLVLTDPGERLFNPYFGCGIRGALGEPDDPFIVEEITRQIALSTSQYDPRIVLRNIVVNPLQDQNTLNVSATFTAANMPEPVTISLLVSRVR